MPRSKRQDKDGGGRLRIGIPSIEEYETFLNSPKFISLQENSNAFKRIMGEAVGPLGWSRGWEYGFVEQELKSRFPEGGIRILDIGSGFNFFPYYLARELRSEITCCDVEDLNILFGTANFKTDQKIGFLRLFAEELRGIKNNTYDAVMCISVMEHIPNPFLLLYQAYRVLRPGGLMVLTCDIRCPELCCGNVPMNMLMDYWYMLFCHFEEKTISINASQSLSTVYILKTHPELLPWKSGNFANLALYCDKLEKPREEECNP